MVWLTVVAVGVQFLLAGTGVMGGESIDPHRGLGMLIILLSLVMLVLAFVAKLPRPMIIMSGVFFLLMILQSATATIEDPLIVRSIHVFDGFLIVAILVHLATRVGVPSQGSADDVR